MKRGSIINWKGLRIKIENPAGSTRSGIDRSSGHKWSVTMTHHYGEILDSMGVDGDPVDVFLGPDKSAPFVFIMHQTDKTTGAFDEDKVFLGFANAMQAKSTYCKNYDLPNSFIGSLESIPFQVFKQKVLKSDGSQMIHASKLNTAIELYAKSDVGTTSINLGDPVTVNGMHGRGVIVGKKGNRVIIRFRSGVYMSRNISEVHNMDEGRVSKLWRD